MWSLKQSLGIVILAAIVMACMASTIQPPGLYIRLPGGLLFALTLVLCAIAIGRTIAALPRIDRFWAGFLSGCVMCFVVSFSAPVLSVNAAPEQIALIIHRQFPLDAKAPPGASDERFYAVQGIVSNSFVLLLAIGCGLVAQGRTSGHGKDSETSR